MCIEHGFRRSEGLGRNQKEGALRPDLAQHVPQLMSIDIRDKVKLLTRIHPVFQRLHHHFWAKVRTTNPNVDHIRDA